jgi:hypothetical protein
VTQGASSHKKRRTLFWWSFGLGFFLFALNVAFVFLVAFSTAWGVNPNLGELSSNGDPYLDLKFFLLVSFLFFLAGLVLGRSVRKIGVVLWLNIIACLLGSGAMVVIATIMVILGIGAKEAGWTFILVAAGAPFWIIVEEVAGVSGGMLGGLIGSHFLRKRLVSD